MQYQSLQVEEESALWLAEGSACWEFEKAQQWAGTGMRVSGQVLHLRQRHLQDLRLKTELE